MATIKEVAKRAGVSVGTVSNIISQRGTVSPNLRERVLSVIRELDYHPNHFARGLKRKHTKMLGMIIPDITNPFFPQLVRGAEDAALQHGYLLVTFNTDDRVEREQEVLAVLRSRGVDGILLTIAHTVGRSLHIERTLEAGVPIVCLDRIPPRLPVDAIATDNQKGAEVCIRHLLSIRHRKIAIITGPMDLRTAQDRFEGYQSALREAKLKPEPDLIAHGDYHLESGYRLAKDFLLRRTRPTALFVSNGMMALGVVKALEETRFRCPHDIAVATFDDLPIADVFRPRLTAVAQPVYEIGRRGVELLIQRIEGRLPNKKPIQILLDPELKIRESTGFPGA
jgi:LacI family transcriptional regulator, galactose operon repressor